jgi:hypothetical protein
MLIDDFDLNNERLLTLLSREAKITYRFPEPPKNASCRRLQRSIGSIDISGNSVVIRYIVSSEEKKRIARQDDEPPDFSHKDLKKYEKEDDVFLEVLKRISSVPSTIIEPVELCESTMKFSFRYHFSDSPEISRILMDISEKHNEVSLGYIGESPPLISSLGRIARYCNFMIFRFTINPDLDESLRIAAGRVTWERIHKQIYSNGQLEAIYRFSKHIPDKLASFLKPISVNDGLYAGVVDNPIIAKFQELTDKHELIKLGTIDECNGKRQQLYVLSLSRTASIMNQITREISDAYGDGSIAQLPPIELIDAVGVAATKTSRNNTVI